ncbi:MAG: DNA polymerase III subunit beta [Pseudomonadales bacterium]
MRFSIQREALLEPLSAVTGVIERRQTLPILSNILLSIDADGLTITGTDQEVELTTKVTDVDASEGGAVTIPARKLNDIWRSLPEGAMVSCHLDGSHVNVESGRFKSHLATLPADDFPKVQLDSDSVSITIVGRELARLLDKCSFAMAQQDVRYFFNGMLMEVSPGQLRAVATNGQRLATSFVELETSVSAPQQFIIPRKGVIELARLVPENDDVVALHFSRNHMHACAGTSTLTTKLIDGTYPDYSRAIPAGGDKMLIGSRRELREALTRAAILSNEMYRNVRLQLSPGTLQINANNPLQEEAEEMVSVDYDGPELEIGFNVGYLIEALGVMQGDQVTLQFSDASSAVLATDQDDTRSRFVISPMMI